MENGHWLSLNDYATKHQVSVSTLRRKIKTGQIEYRLTDGRYVVFETPEPLVPQTSFASTPSQNAAAAVADSLTQELKRAYTNILHEKEAQILDLKEEVVDLKTLVHALEDDNLRLRRRLGEEL